MTPTSFQLDQIAIKIINKLTNRSGFDEAFDVGPEIMEDIRKEIGTIAFEESEKIIQADALRAIFIRDEFSKSFFNNIAFDK